MVLISWLIFAAVAPDAAWLIGGWAPGASACGSDREIAFEMNGMFSESESEGAWSLAGDRLTIRSLAEDNFGRSEIVRVEARGTLEMELEWGDGSRAKYRRCSDQE